MEISSMNAQYVYSLKQALGMANMRRAMNQDAQGVKNLMKSMEATNRAIAKAAEPHKGGSVDIKV